MRRPSLPRRGAPHFHPRPHTLPPFLPQQAAVEEVEAGEEAVIAETGRLFVRNLAYTASESDLSEAFGVFGDVSEVHLVLDRWARGGDSAGSIDLASPASAADLRMRCLGCLETSVRCIKSLTVGGGERGVGRKSCHYSLYPRLVGGLGSRG